MKKEILLTILCLAGLWQFAQTPKYPVLSIPVMRNGTQMRLPWSGGMDSPQFSYIDINGDGIPDLFVFDRASNKAMVFLNTGGVGDTAYQYAPEYEPLLPQGMTGWALMRDYNKDGIPDIFTHVPLGIGVYKGSRPNDVLHYDLVSPYLKYMTGNFSPNVWTNIEDIPVIRDINGDGDIDILAYTIFGTSVSYFENQTEENAGSGNPAYDIDSFSYLDVNDCWGDFTQNQQSNSIVLNDPQCTGIHSPAPPPGGGEPRHTGNSIDAITPYGDSIISILNGNIGYLTLMYLRNCSNSNVNADMCVWDSLWPTCTTPVIIASFPAAFGVHVNGNANLEDLLVAPNSDYRTGFNINNVWQYNNTGDTNCIYNYVGDTFLVEHMPDFGTDSKPVFYDMNGDGLQDIMVGDLGYFVSESVYKSTIAYYQNTGTATQPKFQQVTDDYDSISKFGLTAVSPAFGDLNGDGKPDMIIGDQNGYEHVFINQGTIGSSYTTMTYPEYFALQEISGTSAPFIYDVNGDSLNDLIVGCTNGTLSYYWNYGTKQNAMFSADSSNQLFGGVNVVPYGAVYGFSHPTIMKDTAGNMILLVGSAGGTIFEYVINPDSLRTGSFVCVDSNYMGRNTGADATVSIANITNSGYLNYLVGTEGGGLLMFSDSLYDSALVINSVQQLRINELEIFPNPTRENFTCTTGNVNFVHPQTEVYNILGEQVPAKISVATNKVMVFTEGLSNGFYFIRISDQNKSYTGKVLLQR